MRSVAWRLLLAFLAVTAVAVGTVAYAANQATTTGFRQYVEMGHSAYARRVATDLATFYAANGGWRGVEGVLAQYARFPGDRLVLVDAGGQVIADSAGELPGRREQDLGLNSGTPVVVNNQTVGSLYVLTASAPGGMGHGMMGQGRMMDQHGHGETVTVASTPEEDFLANVNRGLLFGAGGAVLLAVVLSLFLTRQIVRPLASLAAAARRVAGGELGYHVEVRSGDEIGAVASAFNTMSTSLKRNEEARRNLLADIVHELRTPLTVIEGTADGIIDGVLPPTPEQLGIIKEEAGLLAKLVADLRDLSLAEAGRLVLERQPEDLEEVVGRAVRRFEGEARERGVALTLRRAENGDLPPVTIDATRIAQAVGNLISNAIRHTPAGGTVEVVVGRDGERPGGAMVVVSDTGEGIAPEDLPFVFERFYRADKSRSRRSGGSGLGLAIARQLVEAHGGSISAVSEPGRGSSFRILLPFDLTLL